MNNATADIATPRVGSGGDQASDAPDASNAATTVTAEPPRSTLDGDATDEPLPPIRLIPFELFKACGTFPRFPENQDISVNAEAVDRETSLVVFISHCWLRGWAGSPGFDTRPHPDNAQGSKFQLIVKAVEKALRQLAPGMTQCYLWCDYGCMDQDGNPAGELKQLDKIVQLCDCLLTPIFDEDWATWELPTQRASYYEDYKSKLWGDGPYAYLNRGWCRVEMLYGATIPLLPNSDARMARFAAGLKAHLSNGHRCHMLYGDWNVNWNFAICILPPLQHSYFDMYHPSKGHLSVDTDRVHIDRLVKLLEPYIQSAKEGYEGDWQDGKKHGKGLFRFADGSVYEGDFKDDYMHGTGVKRFAFGAVFEGAFVNGKMHGKGVFRMPDGAVHEGDYQDDKWHGKGTLRYADGGVFEGEYREGKMHGTGVGRYADGNVYEGEYREGKWHGTGVFWYADGGVYQGEFRSGKKHGNGVARYINGDLFEGEYVSGKKHGKGVFRFADGSAYEGDFKEDTMNGSGVYRYANGSVYEGEFVDGLRSGPGIMRYAGGRVYDGLWINDEECP